MSTYFGNNTAGSGVYGIGNPLCVRNKNLTWTCPGSGAQDVDELGVRCRKVPAGNNIDFRCAIYDTSLNHLMEGSVDINVSSEVFDFANCAHTSFIDDGDVPIGSPQLTGGVNYILAAACDLFWGQIAYDQDGSSGDIGTYSADYTGGAYPDPIGAGADDSERVCIRCGVTAAAGVLSIMNQLQTTNLGADLYNGALL